MEEKDQAIEIRGLHKIYKSGKRHYEALKGIDLNVESGRIFGFLGPNGAGKSTTIKIIVGLIYATSGSVKIFGQPVSDYTYRKYIGYLPERPRFYENLTGIEIIAYYGRLLGLEKGYLNRARRDLLERLGLSKWGDMSIKTYSQGMNQKLGLILSLLGEPRLLILDEPMSGLDPLSRKQVRDLLLELKRKGITIFFSSHILYDVEMFCDHVAIIKSGSMLIDMDISMLLDRSILGYEIVAKDIKRDTLSALKEIGVSVEERLGRTHILCGNEKRQKALEILFSAGADIISFMPQKQSLEDTFIEKVIKRGTS